MPPETDADIARARAASGDELQTLLHDAREEILLALIENPNLEEPHVAIVLERLDLPATVLSAVAAKPHWAALESVRARLARHPRTPKKIALALVRQLYLFDLVKLSLIPSAPADIRRIAEEVVVGRVPHLSAGEKLTLARRAPSRVAAALVAEGHPQALKIALENPRLTESQVLKVLAKVGVAERVVVAIAQHAKWCSQYNVRMALMQNSHTPAGAVAAFLPSIPLPGLNEMSALGGLAPHLKKYLEEEYARRTGLAVARPLQSC